jgi:tryptophan halogenase
MKNIVVLGGGTAGWITALYANRIFPEHRVTLIESKEIGILGAGEGSTPLLVELFDFLNIPVSTFIKETKTTIKNGIKFTNWSQDQEHYHHGFAIGDTNFSNSFFNNSFNDFELETLPLNIINEYIKNNNVKESDLPSCLSEQNKVSFKKINNFYPETDPIFDLSGHAGYAIHFDARLLATKLSEIGQQRGINVIEGIVTSTETDQDGNINKILLDSQNSINSDFIFDCSGFARFFIGKHFKSEWQSLSEYLPMKKAIPFFLEMDESIPPYTESIAMDYGWMWKIPLQHRYGCGYVFDSNFINEEQAVEEVEKFLGHTIEQNKVFSFEPGFFKEVWIKNCVAVGLASGFVEPLEATSLLQLTTLLKSVFLQKNNIFDRNDFVIKEVNSRFQKETLGIVDILYLHYVTNKQNNDFWKNFTINNKMPETLKENINILNNSLLYPSRLEKTFGAYSYYKIMIGNDLLNKENMIKIFKSYKLNIFDQHFEKQNYNARDRKNEFMSHNDFLKMLGGLND